MRTLTIKMSDFPIQLAYKGDGGLILATLVCTNYVNGRIFLEYLTFKYDYLKYVIMDKNWAMIDNFIEQFII